jgi:hypothetical protein
MSALVGLKMEGRLAGAILTVLSRGGRDDGERKGEVWRPGVGYIFRAPADWLRLAGAPAILAHKNQFCGVPRQGSCGTCLARSVGYG